MSGEGVVGIDGRGMRLPGGLRRSANLGVS
jgi:hypothetical protein